uniref:CSON007328 protein n=1 Tax=Culicoides sonorensis TaxID=179676 RepID=A0A336MU13_CULSO
MKTINIGSPLNIFKNVIIRYIRLTTALIPVILFTVGPMIYMGSGPEWTSRISQVTGFCDKYWWSALLHVQNYVNPYEVCVGQAWYLSVDFQLYLVSPLILYPLWKYGRKFLWIIIGLILVILTYILIICIYKEIYISLFLRDTADLYKYLYGQTHVKALPWLMGIILGYILFETKDKSVKILKIYHLFAWIFSILIILAIIFAPIPLQTAQIADQPKVLTVIYQTLHTFGWTLALAWIIFACCHNFHEIRIINHFLAHPFWLPFARIAFCVYLVHLPMQYVMIGSKKQSGHFNDTSTLHAFCGDVGFAILIGLIWHLMFECPFNVLTKDNFKQNRDKNDTLNEVHTTK